MIDISVKARRGISKTKQIPIEYVYSHMTLQPFVTAVSLLRLYKCMYVLRDDPTF